MQFDMKSTITLALAVFLLGTCSARIGGAGSPDGSNMESITVLRRGEDANLAPALLSVARDIGAVSARDPSLDDAALDLLDASVLGAAEHGGASLAPAPLGPAVSDDSMSLLELMTKTVAANAAGSTLLEIGQGADPTHGANMAAPPGYKAKAGSGKCLCRGSGHGLYSCGTLCCAASPYTDPNPAGQYYFGKAHSRSEANLCYERDSSPVSTGKVAPVAVPFANGWANYGHSYSGAQAFVNGGSCVVSGLIKGTSWGHVATLPSNCRPAGRLIFNLNNHAKTARVDVTTDGKVTWVTGGKDHSWLSLTVSIPIPMSFLVLCLRTHTVHISFG